MKQKKNQNVEPTPKKTFQPKKRIPKTKIQDSTLETPFQNETREMTHTPSPVSSAPIYEVPSQVGVKKTLSFSRLIANEDILTALQKTSFATPSEILATVLPATLRASDTLIFQSKQEDEFLIGAISALAQTLQNQDNEKKTHSPLALLLFSSDESLKAYLSLTKNTFPEFDFSSDILFSTPNTIVEAQRDKTLNLNNLKILCVNELDLFDGPEKEALHAYMSTVSSSVQKIFISYQNTPKIREFAFKYLEDPEIFSFLSLSTNEQSTRQFAHALEATKKFQVLLGYLKTYKPRAALVVANTKTVAEWLAFKLDGNGIKVALITSPIHSSQKRNDLLNSVSKGEINVFVMTDFALKNFGIENINCVYHFDLPDNPNLYIERLHKVYGSRNPISIGFICEDYGFNMGQIEDTLGFKVKITTPDRAFFNFKDTSDYPLESSGRVKMIGYQPGQVEQKASEQKPVENTLDVPKKPEHKPAEKPTLSVQAAATLESKHKNNHSQSRPDHRRSENIRTESAERIDIRAAEAQLNETTASTIHSKPVGRHYQPDTSKFVRRDERAREAVADALLAAKIAEEKRKTTQFQKTPSAAPRPDSQSIQKQDTILSSVFFIVSEAVRAGIHATKDSLTQNTEGKFPALHRFLNRNKKK